MPKARKYVGAHGTIFTTVTKRGDEYLCRINNTNIKFWLTRAELQNLKQVR